MIRFKYRKETGKVEKVVFRPVADIEFESKNGEWIECHPYIDSGADVTLLRNPSVISCDRSVTDGNTYLNSGLLHTHYPLSRGDFLYSPLIRGVKGVLIPNR
ncbi:MAG: hypothetical protein QME42_07050 [bacterium]|nr:hypothetical protein [bacterium]